MRLGQHVTLALDGNPPETAEIIGESFGWSAAIGDCITTWTLRDDADCVFRLTMDELHNAIQETK